MGTHLVNFLVLLILSRLLTPAQIGLVALATTFVSAGTIVLDLGLGQALIQRRRPEAIDLDTVFWVTLSCGVLLAAVLMAGADTAARVFGEPTMGPVLRWTSLTFLLLGLSATPTSLLQRELAFGRLAARTLVAEVAGGVAGISLALNGFGVWSLVARNLVRELTAVLMVWQVTAWRPRLRSSMDSIRRMASFGLAVMGNRGLEFLSLSADQLLIGFFAGPAVLGYYVVALRILRVVRQLITESIGSVAFPYFSRLQDDLARMRKSFLAGMRLTALVAFPAFLGLALVAEDLIAVVLGPVWAPSAPVMRALAFLGLIQAIGFFPGAVLLAVDRPLWRFVLNLLNSVGNVAAILVAIPAGLVWVATAQALRAALLFPLSLRAAGLAIGVRWRDSIRAWLPATTAGVLLVIAQVAARPFLHGVEPPLLRLGAQVGLGVASYGLGVGLLDRKSVREALELSRGLLARPLRHDDP